MFVRAEIHDGPLNAASPVEQVPGAGALVEFEGVVREDEQGSAIDAIRYEVYEPMASRMLVRIGREIGEQCGVLRLEIDHSRGVVPVGCCSLRVRIQSAHRAQAFAAMTQLIDRLKKDVPIWKHIERSSASN